MTTYLIAGGAGFIGSHLSHMCIRLGHRVICIDTRGGDRRSGIQDLLPHPNFSFFCQDASDGAAIREYVNLADITVHLASASVPNDHSNRDRVLAENFEVTSTLVSETTQAGKTLLLVSSAEVYQVSKGTTGKTSIGAGSPEHDVWAQAVSKLADECLVEEAKSTTIVARLFPTLGPRQSTHYAQLVLDLFDRALAGRTMVVPGDGSTTRSYTYISDVVHWLLLLSRNHEAVGRAFDLGTPELTSDIDLAGMIRRITDSPVDLKTEGSTERSSTVRPDIQPIKQLTGYTPRVRLYEALRRIHDWYLTERPTMSQSTLGH